MIVENYSNVRQNLKMFCDLVVEKNEELIITRREGKNVVVMSLDKYNSLVRFQNDQMEK